MARLKNNPAGTLSGTIGNVVASSWNGVPYLRSLPVKSNKPPSPAQLRQRQRFATVVRFLRPMQPLLETTFRNTARNMSGYNAAISYNYRHALVETAEGLGIDYSIAAVSLGPLPNVAAPVVEPEPGGVLWFHWTNNAGRGTAIGQDPVVLVAYCPELGQCIFRTGPAMRCDETATLDAKGFAGKSVACWIACLGRDGKSASASAWLDTQVATP